MPLNLEWQLIWLRHIWKFALVTWYPLSDIDHNVVTMWYMGCGQTGARTFPFPYIPICSSIVMYKKVIYFPIIHPLFRWKHMIMPHPPKCKAKAGLTSTRHNGGTLINHSFDQITPSPVTLEFYVLQELSIFGWSIIHSSIVRGVLRILCTCGMEGSELDKLGFSLLSEKNTFRVGI